MDRRFTFSDPRIIHLLQSRFVPAVGNTHELQNQRFAAGKWFMAAARGVNPRINEGATAQGFYVVAADGQGYGFNNNRDPERVLGFLNRNLNAFVASPPTSVEISDEEVQAAFCVPPPAGVTLAQVTSRISPLPAGADPLNSGTGRDTLWIYPDEVKEIRDKQVLPAALTRRLARFHLVDNVRGEPDMWRPAEVQKLELTLRRQGTHRFSVAGTFRMDAGTRGLEGKLEGVIELEPKSDQLKDLRLYAAATAWGAGTYTPRPPAGRFPLLFAVTLARDESVKVTPPQAALYGDSEYRRPQ